MASCLTISSRCCSILIARWNARNTSAIWWNAKHSPIRTHGALLNECMHMCSQVCVMHKTSSRQRERINAIPKSKAHIFMHYESCDFRYPCHIVPCCTCLHTSTSTSRTSSWPPENHPRTSQTAHRLFRPFGTSHSEPNVIPHKTKRASNTHKTLIRTPKNRCWNRCTCRFGSPSSSAYFSECFRFWFFVDSGTQCCACARVFGDFSVWMSLTSLTVPAQWTHTHHRTLRRSVFGA